MPTRSRLATLTLATLSLATLSLATLSLAACDEAKQAESESTASLQANATIAAKDFELAAVVELVEREDVRDAESLEALINAEDSTIQVDVDGDGKRDFIAVHEVTLTERAGGQAKVEVEAEADGAATVSGADGDQVRFELRAVPSSQVTVESEAASVELESESSTVIVATVDIELQASKQQVVVEASYAPTLVIVSEPGIVVERTYVHHVELEHRRDHLVVVGAPFIAWVWIDVRPVYVGHVHLPPGHAKHMGLHWHGHGHHGHGGHVDVHHGGHGGHHGGPSKVQVKSKGGGGPSKVQVKAKGGGGPSKVQVKAKGGGGGKGKH